MRLQGASAPRGWALPCGRASGAGPGWVDRTALLLGRCPLPADGGRDGLLPVPFRLSLRRSLSRTGVWW